MADITPPAETSSLLSWALGGITALATGAIGHLHARVNRVEDRAHADTEAAKSGMREELRTTKVDLVESMNSRFDAIDRRFDDLRDLLIQQPARRRRPPAE